MPQSKGERGLLLKGTNCLSISLLDKEECIFLVELPALLFILFSRLFSDRHGELSVLLDFWSWAKGYSNFSRKASWITWPWDSFDSAGLFKELDLLKDPWESKLWLYFLELFLLIYFLPINLLCQVVKLRSIFESLIPASYWSDCKNYGEYVKDDNN